MNSLNKKLDSFRSPKSKGNVIHNQHSLKIDNQTVFFKTSENMEEIPDKFIDVIVTSPPYNRNKNYYSDTLEKYNAKRPENEYLDFLKRVWKDCYRIASDECVFFLNIGDSAKDQGISEKVANSVVETGWTRIQDIIWAKSLYGRGHYTPSGGIKDSTIFGSTFFFL